MVNRLLIAAAAILVLAAAYGIYHEYCKLQTATARRRPREIIAMTTPAVIEPSTVITPSESRFTEPKKIEPKKSYLPTYPELPENLPTAETTPATTLTTPPEVVPNVNDAVDEVLINLDTPEADKTPPEIVVIEKTSETEAIKEVEKVEAVAALPTVNYDEMLAQLKNAVAAIKAQVENWHAAVVAFAKIPRVNYDEILTAAKTTSEYLLTRAREALNALVTFARVPMKPTPEPTPKIPAIAEATNKTLDEIPAEAEKIEIPAQTPLAPEIPNAIATAVATPANIVAELETIVAPELNEVEISEAVATTETTLPETAEIVETKTAKTVAVAENPPLSITPDEITAALLPTLVAETAPSTSIKEQLANLTPPELAEEAPKNNTANNRQPPNVLEMTSGAVYTFDKFGRDYVNLGGEFTLASFAKLQLTFAVAEKYWAHGRAGENWGTMLGGGARYEIFADNTLAVQVGYNLLNRADNFFTASAQWQGKFAGEKVRGEYRVAYTYDRVNTLEAVRENIAAQQITLNGKFIAFDRARFDAEFFVTPRTDDNTTLALALQPTYKISDVLLPLAIYGGYRFALGDSSFNPVEIYYAPVDYLSHGAVLFAEYQADEKLALHAHAEVGSAKTKYQDWQIQLRLQAGFNWQFNHRLAAQVDYQYQELPDYATHLIRTGLTWKF